MHVEPFGPPARSRTVSGGLLAASVALALAGAGISPDASAQENVRLMGYLENAMIVEANIVMEAKLDTGADNSSVHAPDRELFEKNGEQWVRFTIEGSKRGRAELEKKVERIARIEQRVGVNAERPVVFMSLCLGDVEHIVEVNLADRTGLSYPMLIGRSFLEKGVLVNSSDKFTVEPSCGKK